MEDLFRHVRELVDIPSTTGDEAVVAARVGADLEAIGFAVAYDEVEPGRPNVIARLPGHDPDLWFCTHLDTVPPFFASHETDTHIGGRGSCDAKGILSAMLFAARELVAGGATGLGLVFTVGEEVDSAGAIRLNRSGSGRGHLVCGEPTRGFMAVGHKGTLRMKIRTRGKAAHSAYPEVGDSAVHRLLALLERLRSLDWERSDLLGEVTVNVGVISGGVAGNVLAPSAEATVYWRLVGAADPARERIETLLAAEPHTEFELVGQNDAVHCRTLPGFPTTAVAYSTDIPFMDTWGVPLLIGPGSIHDAHTARERVAKSDLVDAVGYYRRIGEALLD